MKPQLTNSVEDSRFFKKLLLGLHENYPPRTVQHQADLASLARLNWQNERIANLLETDLNYFLQSEILRKIKNPGLRLLKATRRALARRDHQLLIKQNEANLRSTHTLATRVDKWNSTH